MRTQIITLILVFYGVNSVCQVNPSDKGYDSYQIIKKNDTINFYLYNPKKITKKHLLIHVDGSLPAPLWVETNPCCVTLDPFNAKTIPEEYAYVVISKHEFNFSDKENFKISKTFWKKNTLNFRVERVNEVIKHIQNNIFKPNKIVVVGTSQGTDVVAKLSTINKDITNIGFFAGGGNSQLMEFIMFIRKEAIAGKISEKQAADKIESLLKQFEKMFDNPSPDIMWEENSYLSYVSFSEPPIQNLLKLNIPIFVAIGAKDENVAIENSYIIPIEFIRHRKKNLTFKQYPDYDHGFVEKLENGEEIDRFDNVSEDFFKWLKEN